MPEPRELRIVFEDLGSLPGKSGTQYAFVEVEDERGMSRDVGEWRDRADGLKELVIPLPVRFSESCDSRQPGDAS